jgi:hypothetical protein
VLIEALVLLAGVCLNRQIFQWLARSVGTVQ